MQQEEAPYPDISAELPEIELERNQTDGQTDGPTDVVNNDPEPNSEELAASALENADICPGNHIQNQLVEAPAEAREVVYNIELNLPGNMAPVTINDDQLATNGSAIMVEDIDDEEEFNSEDEDEPVTAASIPLPLPYIPPSGVEVAAPRHRL